MKELINSFSKKISNQIKMTSFSFHCPIAAKINKYFAQKIFPIKSIY
jgi:hypothetical protein